MAVNLEQAQAAVDAAQKAYDDAIKSGKVRDAANASKALSAAKRNLEAAKQGVDTAGKTRKDILKEQRAKEFTRRAEERAKTETPAFYLAPEGSKIKGYDITYRPQAPESKTVCSSFIVGSVAQLLVLGNYTERQQLKRIYRSTVQDLLVAKLRQSLELHPKVQML